METRCKIKYGEGWQLDWKLLPNSYNEQTAKVSLVRIIVDAETGKATAQTRQLFCDRVEWRNDSDSDWISCDPDELATYDDINMSDDEREEYRLANLGKVGAMIVDRVDIMCKVCGEVVERSGGRGRPRQIHEECRG